MTASFEQRLADGARNLVVNCAALRPGEKVLIVHEDPALGWYDAAAVAAAETAVRRVGIEPDLLAVGVPDAQTSAGVFERLAAYDCTLFFSRIGDSNRFDNLPADTRGVMVYARDAAMLASDYGRAAHAAMADLKAAVNRVLFGAARIDIGCPLGTRISGKPAATGDAEAGDVSIRRFPVGVPRPMEAAHFSGRVALAHYLTPTGSRLYEPSFLALDDTVFAAVDNGRIAGFDGPRELVARVREHYRRVAAQFDIDADAVDSWHAGIHPGCAYRDPARRDPDRWSNTVFTNPRTLHFHTCGSYPPGEICWLVVDPTVTVDGVALWDRGRLRPEAFAPGRDCLRRRPELAALLARPADAIGMPV